MAVNEAEIKIAFFCVVTGGTLIYRAFRKRRIVRTVVDTARSRLGTAPQGYVEVQGFAWPAQSTVRNSAGEEAVYYSLTIEKKVSRGTGKNRRTEWVTVFTRSHVQDFYLTDATGLALVDAASAEIETRDTSRRTWNRLGAEEKRNVLAIVGTNAIGGFPPSDAFFGIFGGQFRVTEREILVGSPLYANGDFRSLGATPPKSASAGLSEFHGRVFDLQARAPKNLAHFLDKNKDGKVCADESRRGYVFAAKQTRTKAQREPRTETEYDIHGRLGTSSARRLFLADQHEETLVENLGRFVWLQFIGGSALIALALAGLFTRLDLTFPGKGNRAMATDRSAVSPAGSHGALPDSR